ncbi:unnamed protein product [Parnassius mnemosyne]|uniref:PiggyBac transposable element-derived protein domain-containing protein n=1 Tax=Parnassius mnemosyne TaxID=213953 RepID=A0AAV1LS31_9NEOP
MASNRQVVSVDQPNAESILLDWLNDEDCTDDESQSLEPSRAVIEELLSDSEDDCIPSDHDSDSEYSVDSDDEDVLTSGESTKYYYGKNRFKWSSEPPSRNIRTQSHNILRLPSNQNDLVTENGPISPLDAFQLIFDNQMIETILEWTNKKLEIVRETISPKEQYAFKETSQIELKGFLSLLLYSAAFKSNHESVLSLFATDGTGRPIFRVSMSKKRFLILLLVLRFDNFTDREARKIIDPGCAVTEFLEMFNKNSQARYVPGANVTVDEMLLAFRGRCRFKMYIPSKPAKYGVKVQCLADSATFYVYNTYIYTGKGSDSYTLSEEDKKKPVPTQAVLRLCKSIFNTNRNITTDNWYSSIELSQKLKNKGLTTVGTLKKNKAVIPKEFLPAKNKELNSSLFGFTKDCTLVRFVPKKNKAVILYSTMHHDSKINPESLKPEIIEYYNDTKSGVDSVDQKCSVYSCSRRTRRWPMAVFFRILDMSAWNSYVIHKSQAGISKMTRLNYIKGLAEQLNDMNLKSRQYNERLPRQLRELISDITKVPLVEEQQVLDDKLPRNQRKYCHICPKRLKRKTSFLCHTCMKPVCLACTKKICTHCVATAKD